jgi:hypothetical protein
MLALATVLTVSWAGGAVVAAPVTGCGAQSTATVATVDAHVLSTIYRNDYTAPRSPPIEAMSRAQLI